MTSPQLRLVVALLAVLIAGPARADGAPSSTIESQDHAGEPGAPSVRKREHGGVLCIWSILLLVRDVGDRCIERRDAAFQDALDVEIARLDRFIAQNAPLSTERLDALKKSRPLTDPKMDVCTAKAFYDTYRQWGVANLSEDVTDLLAVPRKPTWGPCL